MLGSLTDDKPTLTPRQREIYEFLKDKILNRGYGPTVREIGAEFGIRSPNGVMCHLKALEKKGLITRESHMSRAIQLAESPHQRMTLPLAGVIAAGHPIQADELNERIDFAPLFDAESHFCLRARGDSMQSEQIGDGDYLVVKRQSDYAAGDLVLVTSSGVAGLRRARREGESTVLQDSTAHTSIGYQSDLQVEGVVVGVIRKYV